MDMGLTDHHPKHCQCLSCSYRKQMASERELLTQKLKQQLADGQTVAMVQPAVAVGIQTTLTERKKTHGDFAHTAGTSQHLKRELRLYHRDDQHGRAFDHLPCVQQEALDMICLKLSRIITGDPNHKDHWHDIAGYAALGEKACK